VAAATTCPSRITRLSPEGTEDASFRRPDQNPTVEKKEATWPNDLHELGSSLEEKRLDESNFLY
jgi:hypothetical protein